MLMGAPELGFDFAQTGSGVASGASAGASFGPWGAAIGGAIGGLASIFGGGKKEPSRAQKQAAFIAGGSQMAQQALSSPAALKAFINTPCLGGGSSVWAGSNMRANAYAALRIAHAIAAEVPGLPPLQQCSEQDITYAKAGHPCSPFPLWLANFYNTICQNPEMKARIFAAIDGAAATPAPTSMPVPLPPGPTVSVPSGQVPVQQPFFPTYAPSPIVVGPSQTSAPVSAGMDPWMIAAIVGIGVLALTNRR